MNNTTDQQIIDAMGLGALPQNVKDEAVNNVKAVVELRLVGTLDDMLSDEQRQQFETIKQGDPEQAKTWVGTQLGINVEELYDSLLQDYLQEAKTKVDNIMNQ